MQVRVLVEIAGSEHLLLEQRMMPGDADVTLERLRADFPKLPIYTFDDTRLLRYEGEVCFEVAHERIYPPTAAASAKLVHAVACFCILATGALQAGWVAFSPSLPASLISAFSGLATVLSSALLWAVSARGGGFEIANAAAAGVTAAAICFSAGGIDLTGATHTVGLWVLFGAFAFGWLDLLAVAGSLLGLKRRE